MNTNMLAAPVRGNAGYTYPNISAVIAVRPAKCTGPLSPQQSRVFMSDPGSRSLDMLIPLLI